MQLKISRSSGNYLVLQLTGAVLTYFTDPGPEPEVGIRLADGAEGDDQFRKFLAQVLDPEDGPVPSVETMRSLQRRVISLQEENERLCEQVRQQGIALTQATPTAITELKPRLHEAKIGEGVDGMNMATGALTVGSGNIFHGKSRAWLEGFQANRIYRLDLAGCEELNSPSVPVEPCNPYVRTASDQASRASWNRGWRECVSYLVHEIPDPAQYLEKAK